MVKTGRLQLLAGPFSGGGAALFAAAAAAIYIGVERKPTRLEVMLSKRESRGRDGNGGESRPNAGR
jgi:hypothetical protein